MMFFTRLPTQTLAFILCARLVFIAEADARPLGGAGALLETSGNSNNRPPESENDIKTGLGILRGIYSSIFIVFSILAIF